MRANDLSLDTMLAKLEGLFGSPDVLAPLIISKLQSVQSCSMSLDDLSHLHKNFILPFNKFCDLMGDSLGTYLATTATQFMSHECCQEWLSLLLT